jgi:CHAT domain-containing protein
MNRPFWVFAACMASLVACRTDGTVDQARGTVSLEEAISIEEESREASFIPPPRTTNDLRDRISFPEGTVPKRACGRSAVPPVSESVRQAKASCEGSNKYCAGSLLARQAIWAYETGQLERSNELLVAGSRTRLRSWRSYWDLANLHFLRAFFLAETGQVERARSAYQKGIGLSSQRSDGDVWEKANLAAHKVLGKAAITAAEGDFPRAGRLFDQALRASGRAGHGSTMGTIYHMGAGAFPNGPLMRALVRNLIRQGELNEAEAVTRRYAKQHIRKSTRQRPPTGKTRGDALALLAEVFLAQGRFGDASYFSEVANYAYRSGLDRAVDCRSIPYNEALETWAQAQAAQEQWPEVVALYELIEEGMGATSPVFRSRFAGSPNRAYALLKLGRTEAASDVLATTRVWLDQGYMGSGADVAELQAMQALARLDEGASEQAIADLGQAVDMLTAQTGKGTPDARARRKRIIDWYMGTLLEVHAASPESAAGRQAAAEVFALSDASRGQEVQSAISQASLRSIASDDALRDLVRRQQDITHRQASLQGALNYALSQDEKERALEIRHALNKIEVARAALQQEIRESVPNYDELVRPRPLTLSEVQGLLPSDSALLAFSVLPDRTLVWAVPARGEFRFAQIALSDIDLAALVDGIRATVDPGAISSLASVPAFDLAGAGEIYSRLLAPVSSGWQAAGTLIVVPDGPLGRLPFSLLPTAPVDGGITDGGDLPFSGYRHVPWLARSHSVTMLPALAALRARSGTGQQAGRAGRPFVGFGDPYFSLEQAAKAASEPSIQTASTRGATTLRARPLTRSVDSADLAVLPRLADTRDELHAVAASLNADPASSVFVGLDATEARVKSMDLTPYRVISFATHGLVPGDLNGLDEPALALTNPELAKDNGNAGDGLLTMSEVMGLRLEADWVVLSACNTASADGRAAEAISGLGRAFLYAGARSVLVSHWPVHSAATTLFMSKLFSTAASDQSVSRSEAIRRARQILIDEGEFVTADGTALFSYAHPLFWAPFTIVGDGGGGGPGA